VVKCHPPANRNPTRDEIARCRHLLLGQIELVHPMIIVTLGNVASQTLLGRREGIGELRGGRYLLGDARVVPTYHPAAALRGGARVTEAIREDLQICAQLLRSGNAR
jgi:DNA polymerase